MCQADRSAPILMQGCEAGLDTRRGATRARGSERSNFPARKYPLDDGLAQFRAKQPATAIGPSGAFYLFAHDTPDSAEMGVKSSIRSNPSGLNVPVFTSSLMRGD